MFWQYTELYQDPEPLECSDARDSLVTRAAGDRWVMSGRALAARVPSVIVPGESPADWNILLNPLHPLFASLEWTVVGEIVFDRRFFVVSSGP
jgi:hypothetical protein